jgi:hypothetical protein
LANIDEVRSLIVSPARTPARHTFREHAARKPVLVRPSVLDTVDLAVDREAGVRATEDQR